MPLSLLNDFPDQLSPMLIKELRQGLRARGFTLTFLIFQGLLAFLLLTATASMSSDAAGSTVSAMIFTMFALVALVFQPMRGANAISSEITGNTIEMMVLTRLTASRIVFGKWFAIVSQSALILVSVIPYLILRYFFGGMNLIGEIVLISLIFITSMSLTAIMVGMSGTSARLMRVLPVFAIIFGARLIPKMIYGRGRSFDLIETLSLSDWSSRVGVFLYVCFVVYYGWCALSQGISVIATTAENHSTPRRLVALGLVLIAIAVGFMDSVDPRALLVAYAVILGPAVIVALTEPLVILPPTLEPFLKRGKLGKIASSFLLPGWPSGVFFTVLVSVICAVGMLSIVKLKSFSGFDDEMLIGGFAVFGGLLLPALLAAHFTKVEAKRMGVFMLFLVASLLIMALPAIMAGVYDYKRVLWMFIWDPWVFLTMLGNSKFASEDLLQAVIVVDAILMCLLMISAMHAYRKYSLMFLTGQFDAPEKTPDQTADLK